MIDTGMALQTYRAYKLHPSPWYTYWYTFSAHNFCSSKKMSMKYLNDERTSVSKLYDISISAILTHELVCVPLSLAKSGAIMNSFLTIQSNVYCHCQWRYWPQPKCSWPCVIVCIMIDGHALVRSMDKPTCCLWKIHKSTFSATGDNMETFC